MSNSHIRHVYTICMGVHMAGLVCTYVRVYIIALPLLPSRSRCCPTKKQLGMTFGRAIYAAIMTLAENENSEVSATVRVRKENGNGATQSGRTLFIKFREALVMLSIQIRRESAGGQRPLGFWFILELRSAWCVPIGRKWKARKDEKEKNSAWLSQD